VICFQAEIVEAMGLAMRQINVGLLGLGTVGSGVVALLEQQRELWQRRFNTRVDVRKALVRNPSRHRPGCEHIVCTQNAAEVLNDPDIDIIVEVMGGAQPALNYIQRAIENHKPVVTANKLLIACHGHELFDLAQRENVSIGFEASVAGGIPILHVLRQSMINAPITRITGIINGTCNFILSHMEQNGETFTRSLSEAQALGFAEADPATDIGGLDAAHKLTIIASMAFGIPLKLSALTVTGIENIAAIDVFRARELGYCIRHVAVAERREDGLSLRAEPVLVEDQSLLASVQGAMNAIVIETEGVGDMMFYGPGAGSLATASAILSDIADLLPAPSSASTPPLGFLPQGITSQPMIQPGLIHHPWYLHVHLKEQAGAMAALTGALAQNDISLERIVQPQGDTDTDRVPVIAITHEIPRACMDAAMEHIRNLNCVHAKPVFLPVLTIY